MSISYGEAGTAATGTTSCAVPYPANISAGNLLIIVVCSKYPSAGVPATPSGWTLPTNGQKSQTTGSESGDGGPSTSTVFVKEATGSESGTVTITNNGSNSIVARMFRCTKGASEVWAYACTGGVEEANSGNTYSAVMDSDPGITVGDLVFCISAVNTDIYSYSAGSLTATGVTFGSVTHRFESPSGTGDDCEVILTEHPISSGTSSAAGTFTMTSSDSFQDKRPRGATVLLRLRVTSGVFEQSISGSSTNSSTLQKLTAKSPSGTSTDSGFLQKLTLRNLSGSSTDSGSITQNSLIRQLAIDGLSNSSGILFNLSSKLFDGVSSNQGRIERLLYTLREGSSTSLGTLQKLIIISKIGASASSGLLQSVLNLTLSGISTSSGSLLASITARLVEGASSSQGNIQKLLTTLREGGSNSSGTIEKNTSRTISGSSSNEGNLARLVDIIKTGTSSNIGILQKLIIITQVGVSSAIGTLFTAFASFLAGISTSFGTLVKKLDRNVVAVSTSIGSFEGHIVGLPPVFGGDLKNQGYWQRRRMR